MTGDPSYPPPGDQPLTDRGTEQARPTSTPGTLPPHQITRTRTGGLWVAAISAAVVVLLLLIFILQNGQQVQINLYGANPDLPLGVALLLAAVLGALIVALVGTARVVQLRHVAKRHRDQDVGR
jgi:uncharacterized integral membrane protein